MDMESYNRITEWNKYYGEHKEEVQKQMETYIGNDHDLNMVIAAKSRENELKTMHGICNMLKPYFKPHKSYEAQDLLGLAKLTGFNPELFSRAVDMLVAERYLFQPTVGRWEKVPDKPEGKP